MIRDSTAGERQALAVRSRLDRDCNGAGTLILAAASWQRFLAAAQLPPSPAIPLRALTKEETETLRKMLEQLHAPRIDGEPLGEAEHAAYRLEQCRRLHPEAMELIGDRP